MECAYGIEVTANHWIEVLGGIISRGAWNSQGAGSPVGA